MAPATLAPVLAEVIRLSYPLAFLAGLVSFLSPCVFPLVPAYAGYLGGRAGGPALAETGCSVASGAGARHGAGELALGGSGPGGRPIDGAGDVARDRAAPSLPGTARVPVMANGVAFVLGFTTVFVTLFYVLTALDVAFFTSHRRTINLVAGALVILLGLQTLGLVRIGVLLRERRHLIAPDRAGLVPSFVLGVSFAAGWTPCIGPQLTAILRVAEQGDFGGLAVMLTYCLGLAIPFLVVAALTDRLQGAIRGLNRHLGVVNLVAGGLLIVFGVLLLTDAFTALNRFVPQSPFDL